jgi:hypothetical protein
MINLLSLQPRMFRTRNPMRDTHTDLDRIMTVRRTLTDAIDSARSEREGLQRRLDLYYVQALSVLDNSAAYGERAREDEDAIETAERNAAAASARIRVIEGQITHLTGLLAQLDEALPANVA